MLKLAGSRAVITGASRGIGVVVAEALALRGADVVIAARSANELDEVARRIGLHGRRVISVPTDVSKRIQVEALIARAESELGGIDIVVNNAAIEAPSYFQELGLDEIEQQVAVNLLAPMLLTRLVLPGMIARQQGHIVNIASLAGLAPSAFDECYGATKAGLIGFTRSLRTSLKECGHPVSTSVVCPGFVSDTGMYEDSRKSFGVTAPKSLGTSTPDAVAAAVLRCIEKDEPELIVNPTPIRPMLGVAAVAPRTAEWILMVLQASAPARLIADRRREATRRRP